MATNIPDLADAGCDVIVDDVLYLAEPVMRPPGRKRSTSPPESADSRRAAGAVDLDSTVCVGDADCYRLDYDDFF